MPGRLDFRTTRCAADVFRTSEGLSHIICSALSALQVVPVMHSSTKLGKGTNELFSRR